MSTISTTQAAPAGFREARRELGVTGDAEKRLLVWLAARLPARVGPDHLTALGFAATVAAAALYAASSAWPWALLAVNLALVVNWFGDSLDGTLARVRRTPRPRYGFYVDHLLDSIGSALLVAAMAAGGLVRPWLAAALVVAYLLVSIEVYLATYTLGRFKIAYGGLGGTELRIVLALVNVATFAWPGRVVWGASVHDVVAALATAGLVVTLSTSGWRNGRELFEAERA